MAGVGQVGVSGGSEDQRGDDAAQGRSDVGELAVDDLAAFAASQVFRHEGGVPRGEAAAVECGEPFRYRPGRAG